MDVSRDGMRKLDDSDFAALMRAQARAQRRAGELADMIAGREEASTSSPRPSPVMPPVPGKLIMNGRMLRDPRPTETASEYAVTLRIDDAQNAEFWLEMYITSERLVEWLEQIAAQRGEERGRVLALLREVRGILKS